MLNQDSWVSEFRKRRFYERQHLKKQKNYLEQKCILKGHEKKVLEGSLFKKTKQIAVMLDLEGTSEKITEKTAEIFVKQLEFIRKKFEAEIGTISISTYCHNSEKMQSVLDILSASITDNIKIGLSFYYGGIYDFENKMDELQEFGFNSNKLSTFSCFYLQDFLIENTWFAIIDDGISEDIYKTYQNERPMLIARPSKDECDLVYNNFMNIATKANDFDGVIEILDTYIASIKDLSPREILEKQKNMIGHLSSWELTNKIREHDYSFLERYFSEGYADEADYQVTLTWLSFTKKLEYSKEEIESLRNVFILIKNKYEKEENNCALTKVRELTQLFKINGI